MEFCALSMPYCNTSKQTTEVSPSVNERQADRAKEPETLELANTRRHEIEQESKSGNGCKDKSNLNVSS